MTMCILHIDIYIQLVCASKGNEASYIKYISCIHQLLKNNLYNGDFLF